MEPPAGGLADELLEQLTRLEGLLARMAESRWALAMVRCREEVERRRDDSLPDAARLILTMFGGMGSLNDVILYRDERFVRAENDEFQRQKERLWELARAAVNGAAVLPQVSEQPGRR